MEDLSKTPVTEQTEQTLTGRLAFLSREKKHFLSELGLLEDEITVIVKELEERRNK